MRVLMLHNRYLQRGGEDISFEQEVALLREKGCEVIPYEENNERIKSLGIPRTAARTVWSTEVYRKIRKEAERQAL